MILLLLMIITTTTTTTIMSIFYSANFNSDNSACCKALMISDRHQTEAGKIHTIWQKCHVALWICDIKQMCLQTALKVSIYWAHLMETGSVFQRVGMACATQNNACQNLPGNNEVSSRDVYPQIVETSQVCRATILMIKKVEPCHVEPCRPATGSCNLFCAQLAASVNLSILVLYGHISAIRRQYAQDYSSSVVAEALNIHWYHTECFCNNPNGMSLPNLSFFSVVSLSRYFR